MKNTGAAFMTPVTTASGRLLGLFLVLEGGARRLDGNRTGLHRLGNLLDQADGQQPVFQISAANFDMIGQVELALEAAIGNTAIQVGLFLTLVRFLATYAKYAFFYLDIEFTFFESGNRQRDRVAIFPVASIS